MTMTAEQLAQLREVAANLKDVARHSVDGYGRQDIHYNDPEGEFVFYSDYAALLDELERKDKRIAELEGQAIKFPPKVERDDSDGYWMLKGQRVSAANAAYYNEALKDVALALFAAGIKCEVKGE